MAFPDSIHHEKKAVIPLHELLDERAVLSPDGLAFRFLADGETKEHLLTYGELAARARTIASGLIRRRATEQPVLLIHPPGLAFIEGLFACWYAGAIAVPAYPPRGGRHRRRLESILLGCGASLALAPRGQAAIPGVTILEHEDFLTGEEPSETRVLEFAGPCLLQFTSGSTAEPKGVMISHQNLRCHFASLECYDELDLKSALSWLPPYHDMGLVLKILYAFEAGIPLTFFSPDHFIQRPLRWLRAISRYRAELSGAPNFAFEMCLRTIRDEEIEGLDLACWKAAPCGAERVRPETLERFAKRFGVCGFRPEAFLPGYGLAESTLIVTASIPNEKLRFSTHSIAGPLVSSGAPLSGVSVRIVNTVTNQECEEHEIGEIRVRGSVVSAGYWNLPRATDETFGPASNRELHTGDLGYLDDGQLYVTGRIKDLIIIDGTNFSPEDIEAVAFSAAMEITAVAAFAVESGGRETIVLALEADDLAVNHAALCHKVRHTIGGFLEVPIRRVILVRNGFLPRTTSGKIRRAACREALLSGQLKLLFDDEASPIPTGIPSSLLLIVLDSTDEIMRRDGAKPEDDIIGLGMTSMGATRLAALLQARTGIAISLGELFSARSLYQISTLLANKTKVGIPFPVIEPATGLNANILTHSQERMWYLHQLDPKSAAYHVFGSLEMTGPLNAGCMGRAVRTVISGHEILCSRHGIENGQPRVWIERNDIPDIIYQVAEGETAIHDYLTNFARKPFVLAREAAVRIGLIACGVDRHILAICIHHIIADGWSIRLLASEIAATYAAFLASEIIPIRPARTSYFDYAVCHRKWIESGAVDSQIAYWKSKLAGHSGILQLATDFPRPAKPSSEGGAIESTIPAALCNRVSALAKVHRATPFMVHLAAFLLLLRRQGAGDGPVIAVPVANRNHAVASDLIGTLVNTLPFRLLLDPSDTFASLLERVRDATFEMQAAQDAPFEQIIAAVKPDRSRDHSPLAQVMFDYQEIPIPESWAGGLKCRPFIAHRGAVQFDLSLLLNVLGDRQQLSIEYRTDLFLPETAAAFSARYLETLEAACREPGLAVAKITGLTESDKSRLASVSYGPVRPDFPKHTTPALIAKRTTRHPERIAVVSETGTLDYATLESRASQLASALRDRGVLPGDRVGLLLNRDADLAVALLATWKTGAAYVPLDSANPQERLKLILDDLEPLHLLASPDLTSYLPPGTEAIFLDEALMKSSSDFTPHQNSPADAAYVIYTSGSTGKPKGVVISHAALANFLLSMAEAPGFTEADRLLAVTTVSFDISALEIFLPLVMGGNLDLVSTSVARDGPALMKRLKSSNATVMQATPATWRLLIDSGWQGSPDLKILCGGESLDLPLASQLSKMGRELWNLYGPTETTVWSTLWRVPENPDRIRIGLPIANTGIHILAADGSPLPPGVPGELWISGDGLADGYWKRPELTASSFVSLPHAPRRYHTGDLARLHPDGTFECLGRSDGQVKIRGFRVELGEIETTLATHPQVARAKTAFRGDDPASRKVIAWITLHPGTQSPDMAKIREFMAARLPAYMLPAEIGVIESFPLNSNGKVDISKLGSPLAESNSDEALTSSEKKLGDIWSELLQRPAILRDDDWFHIGGHSLLALRLFARIHKDFHLSLPLSTILDHSTLRGLAAVIDQSAVEIPSPN